jgi:hypothetical protein
MGGLILIGIVGLWSAVIMVFVFFVSQLITKPIRKLLFAGLLLFVLLPLPLLDEIVGSRQFAELCKEHSKVYFDQKMAIGRTVYLQDMSKAPVENIENTWLRLTLKRWVFLDAVSDEVVIYYDVINAEKRWFSLSESRYPIFFPSYCAGGGDYQTIDRFLEELDIKTVNTPKRLDK